MTRRFAALGVALGLLLGGVGCAAPLALPAGILPPLGNSPDGAQLLTSTDLSRANYRVVRTGAKGESQGFVLLLFFNIIPTSLTDAVDRLYEDAELAPGGPWALTNFVVERQSRSFLLFGLPRVRVRADVIEFGPGVVGEGEGETEGAAPPPESVR